jgi:mercuric ion binding protein
MKALRIFPAIAIMMAFSTISFGQTTKTETFKVSGNCGMCKSKIEKAAKDAGATKAEWNVETKVLTVNYNSTSTNTAKIQQKIAAVGYDNAGAKATSEAYNKLHGCCKYERNDAAKKDKSSCCSDEEACEHKGDHDAKADCCKDGKCTKEGHNGADCCKKSE